MTEQMVMNTVAVSPELAREWLETLSIHQRSVSSSYVKQLSRKMRDGEWRLTPEPISFDTQGKLIEGQHRLKAVVDSGCTVPFTVVRGAPADSFAVIDQGLRRKASQFYGGHLGDRIMAGGKFLRHVEKHIQYNSTGNSPYSWSRMSIDQQMEYVENWPELSEFAPETTAISRKSSFVSIPSRFLLPVLAQAARTEFSGRIEEFLTGMRNGVGMEEGDPRLLLHRRFAVDSALLSVAAKADLGYSLTVKAWNFYAQDVQVKTLKMVAGERRAAVIGSKAAEEWALEPVIIPRRG